MIWLNIARFTSKSYKLLPYIHKGLSALLNSNSYMHRSSVHTAGQDLSCFHSCWLVYSSFHHECPVRSRLMFLKDLIPVISGSGGKISIFCFINFPPCNLHHGHLLFISLAIFHSQIIQANFLHQNKSHLMAIDCIQLSQTKFMTQYW